MARWLREQKDAILSNLVAQAIWVGLGIVLAIVIGVAIAIWAAFQSIAAPIVVTIGIGAFAGVLATMNQGAALLAKRRTPQPVGRKTKWKDIAENRFGIRWVRTEDGRTHKRCPRHPLTDLMFRQVGARGQVAYIQRTTRAFTKETQNYGDGWVHCPMDQEDLLLDAESVEMIHLDIQMEEVLDALVRERKEAERA